LNEICVCILAHNEEKHIAETIMAIVRSCNNLPCDIKVYANGCTDRTAEIVNDLSKLIPNLYLRTIAIASKPNAWNTAFTENNHKILVFSDGDVLPEPNTIQSLYHLLSNVTSRVVLAGCSLCPRQSKISLGQRIIGFLQVPLYEDFLSGGLYACKKNEIDSIFVSLDLQGIPLGIVAEDAFLQSIVPTDKFAIIDKKVYYEPPMLSDYCKYLARIRWQEEQLQLKYSHIFYSHSIMHKNVFHHLKTKIVKSTFSFRLLKGAVACFLRLTVKVIFTRVIKNYYVALGPVSTDGKNILSEATRSSSAK